ncbi:MAG: YjjG family noncanonical pyrimidine nucleotidase [Clostridia bacterium]|nr:YjjG family noncanonical pyrimidine nucleotidase [Clostridia bacterium]
MQRYDTILFDADGTLFDFIRGEREALVAACKIYGYELGEADVKEYSAINDSLWKALERGEVDKETLRVKRFEIFGKLKGFDCDLDKLSHDYTDKLSEQRFLIDGALEIIEKLSGKCRLYIITNGIGYVQRNRFALSPIYKYFSELFISEEVGYEKPSIHFFEYVAERIPDYDPSKTLVVGDSMTSDMKGGIRAGLDCCYFSPKGRGIPAGSGIKYCITKLSELEGIILGE